jgi:glycosyltransferase involved in cell wall biosynthesis
VIGKRKLHIGIDLTGLWREATGIFVAASRLANELLRIDIENNYTLFFSGEVHKDFRELSSNARARVIPTRGEFVTKQVMMGALCNMLRLDVIHFPSFPPPFAYSRPFVWTLHDATPWLYPETMDLKGRLYFQWIGGHAARNSRFLVTDSEDAKGKIEDALGLPPHKVRVVHLGVDDRFKKIVDPELLESVRAQYRLPQKFLLAVGTREPRKNLPALIRAYRRIRDAGETKLGLVIVGRPGWKSEVVDNDIESDGQIVFTGFVPPTDLVALYSLAEIFVLPSLYEGFGLPPLEAMACGCPAIVSDRGSLPEVVGDAAVLIDPENQDSIVAAIRTLEDNQELRRDLSRRGLERAKKFSWNAAAAKTLNLYREVAMHRV